MIWLESIEHDYIKNLKSLSYKQSQVSPERRVLDLKSEVPERPRLYPHLV